MVNRTLDEIIEHCLDSLNKHPNSELVLPLRKEVYRAMGRSVVDGDNRANITEGLIRRAWIDIIATERVLPIWESFLEGRDPHRMVQIAKSYLDGKIDWMDAWEQQNAFAGGLLNVDSFPSEYFYCSYVGHASVMCVLTALKDSYMDDDGMYDEMLDSWDASFYACAAYSGEMPWELTSDIALRRDFWKWWLKTAVPQAFSKA